MDTTDWLNTLVDANRDTLIIYVDWLDDVHYQQCGGGRRVLRKKIGADR